MINWNSPKIKNFYYLRDTVREIKKQVRDQEKTYSTQISENKTASKLYKKHIKKEEEQPIKNIGKVF